MDAKTYGPNQYAVQIGAPILRPLSKAAEEWAYREYVDSEGFIDSDTVSGGPNGTYIFDTTEHLEWAVTNMRESGLTVDVELTECDCIECFVQKRREEEG